MGFSLPHGARGDKAFVGGIAGYEDRGIDTARYRPIWVDPPYNNEEYTMQLSAPSSNAKLVFRFFVAWFALLGFHLSLSYLFDLMRDVSKLPPGFGSELFDSAFYASLFVWPLAFAGLRRKKKSVLVSG